jgi:DNA polymerase elongation subunit (family B)
MYNKFLDDSKLNSTYEYIKDGDKIKYCYLRVPNPIRENVIAFPEKLPKEFDLLGYVDYNMMFEKVFLEPLKPLTEIVGWDTEKRNTIEDFF